MKGSPPVHCFISVGEASGDILAAQLVDRFRAADVSIRFSGILGPELRERGIEEYIPMESLNVMGLLDVMRNLAQIKMMEAQVLALIEQSRIRLAILVDFPGFHFRIAEQLKLRGVKVIQYVAPKLWAWGLRRISRLQRDFDLVLGIFPFEREFFKKYQVPFAFVGCPHISRLADVSKKRAHIGLADDGPLIACLPGSRKSEVLRILPILLRLKALILEKLPQAQFCLPIAGNLNRDFLEGLLGESDKAKLKILEGRSLEAMACADLALVASGTATLECGLLGTPMIVLYRLDSFSYFLAKSKVRTKWISLVNIIMQASIVPEFVQEIDEKRVLGLAFELLDTESQTRSSMLENLSLLKIELENPSFKADLVACISPLLDA